MIWGIGVDIIEVHRINQAIKNELFVKKIYTAEEKLYCESKGVQKSHSFAARFAAKEAIYKALHVQCTEKIVCLWTDIEVCATQNGLPIVRLFGNLKKLQDENNLLIYLSMTHTKEYAVSQAICTLKGSESI